jgi:hypothetical protein
MFIPDSRVAYMECVRIYAWSCGYSDPDLSSVMRSVIASISRILEPSPQISSMQNCRKFGPMVKRMGFTPFDTAVTPHLRTCNYTHKCNAKYRISFFSNPAYGAHTSIWLGNLELIGGDQEGKS